MWLLVSELRGFSSGKIEWVFGFDFVLIEAFGEGFVSEMRCEMRDTRCEMREADSLRE
jgi:hypothetical protein